MWKQTYKNLNQWESYKLPKQTQEDKQSEDKQSERIYILKRYNNQEELELEIKRSTSKEKLWPGGFPEESDKYLKN